MGTRPVEAWLPTDLRAAAELHSRKDRVLKAQAIFATPRALAGRHGDCDIHGVHAAVGAG